MKRVISNIRLALPYDFAVNWLKLNSWSYRDDVKFHVTENRVRLEAQNEPKNTSLQFQDKYDRYRL